MGEGDQPKPKSSLSRSERMSISGSSVIRRSEEELCSMCRPFMRLNFIFALNGSFNFFKGKKRDKGY